MRSVGIGSDRGPIARGRIDIEAGARLHDVGHEQADDQGQCGEEHEIGERLDRNAADRGHVLHRGYAGHHGEEDHRGNDHLDQIDERIAQRLQRRAEIGHEMSEQRARDNRREHLNVKHPVERLASRLCADRYPIVFDHCHRFSHPLCAICWRLGMQARRDGGAMPHKTWNFF